jgi:hypothetical protein
VGNACLLPERELAPPVIFVAGERYPHLDTHPCRIATRLAC